MNKFGVALIYLTMLLSTPQVLAKPKIVNEQSIISPGKDWLSYGRDYQEQRFSPLESINRENVDQLDLVWSFDFSTARGMEATPLIHNGVFYISTGWSHVHAIDARTGKQIWHFDAKVDKAHLARMCCGPVNRGVALWQNGESLQVFFGALDGRLIALDATTGELNWSVQTTPSDSNYSITGAPRVVKGMVIIGNGGGEFGARGFISAYDAIGGEQRWRFYTVPGDPTHPQENAALEQALGTWNGDHWYKKSGGGGTVWDSIVYDPELDLLYIGTGNGSPWNREIRSPGGGDNLFLSSIVALKPDTGDYVWHYQTTPKENWDYTATQHLVLAELEIGDKPRKVIMQAPKNGFFYVLDRLSGELLSADPFTHITWASHVDMSTGRPVETEYADYQNNGGSVIWPAPIGAHNWQPMSYSSHTGLMYIPVQNAPIVYNADEEQAVFGIGKWNTGIDLHANRAPDDWVTAKATYDALVYGELVAWDPIQRKRVWQHKHSKLSNGGILSTAGGLVFQGTQEGLFVAYDAENGKPLWRYKSDSAVLAGPISYELDSEQYIAVAQGSGGAAMLVDGHAVKTNRVNRNRLLVFKKGRFNQTREVGDTQLSTVLALGHEANTDAETIESGAKIYNQNCSFCHGLSARGNDVTPDLRYMSEQTHIDFVAIAFGGSLAHKGMVGFYKSLTLNDIEAVHAYLDQQQERLPTSSEMSWLQKVQYWCVYWISKLSERFPDLANALL